MTEFYEGQSVYVLHSSADANNRWLRGVVRRLDTDGQVEIVEVNVQFDGSPHILLARPGELVRGDAG